MRRPAIVIVALLIASLVPTHALAGYGGPTRILPDGCAGSRTVTDAHGVTRGWVDCGSGLEFIKGTTGAFSHHDVSYSGSMLAVADDGTATYLVLSTERNLRLVKRTHGGSTTVRRLSQQGNVLDAAVMGRHGSWWAVWTEPVDGGYSIGTRLMQAKTIGRDQGARRIFHDTAWNRMLAIAPRPGGGAVFAWHHQEACCGGLYVGLNNGSGWHFHELEEFGTAPVLVRDGDVVHLAYADAGPQRCNRSGYCVIWERWRSGDWRKDRAFHAAPVNAATSRVYLAAAVSKGHVFLGWTALRGDGPTTKGVVAEHTPGHGWAETNVSGPADEELTGIGGHDGAGRAILVHNASSATYDVLRRE